MAQIWDILLYFTHFILLRPWHVPRRCRNMLNCLCNNKEIWDQWAAEWAGRRSAPSLCLATGLPTLSTTDRSVSAEKPPALWIRTNCDYTIKTLHETLSWSQLDG